MLTSAHYSTSRPEAAGTTIAEALTAANVNPRTGLATDYLNHFNEFVMLLDLLPSAPELGQEMLSWAPLSYREHFQQSGFREKDLVIQAYDLSPGRYRKEFDETIILLNESIRTTQLKINSSNDSSYVEASSTLIRDLIARAGSIINGGLSFNASAEDTQDAVDALFD